MESFSGMLTFQVFGDAIRLARRIAQNARVFIYAVSLGKQRSMIYYIPTQHVLRTSFHLTKAQEESYRMYAGAGIFRTSIGLDAPEDLCEDLEQTLKE